jgi:hypothetical protein
MANKKLQMQQNWQIKFTKEVVNTRAENISHLHKQVNMGGTIFMFFATKLHSRYHEVTCQWLRAQPTSICHMMPKRTTWFQCTKSTQQTSNTAKVVAKTGHASSDELVELVWRTSH